MYVLIGNTVDSLANACRVHSVFFLPLSLSLFPFPNRFPFLFASN
jgi:hypothetical protein